MKNESAVNWLIDNILCDIELYINEDGDFIEEPKIAYYNAFKSHVDLTKFVEKAREMEKQQIIDAAYHGVDHETSPYKNPEDYYNNIYGKTN
jgi:hypothetical protein